MKSANALLILIGVLVVGYFGLIASRPSLRNMNPMEVMQALLGDTKDSLRNEKYVPFKAPDLHYRVSFPGTPSELNVFNGWLHDSIVPMPCYFMADNDLGFFINETQISNADAPGRTSMPVIDRPLMGQAVGNNESVAQSGQQDQLMQIQEFLAARSDEMVKNSGATLFAKMPASSGGGRYWGRALEGSTKKTGVRYRLQVFYDEPNKRLFAISVVGKPDEIQSQRANKFLGSLQILP